MTRNGALDLMVLFQVLFSPKVVTIRIRIKLNNMSINVYTYVPIKNFIQE